jgi:hypothetical protein
MGSAHDDTLYYEQEARRRAEVNTMTTTDQAAVNTDRELWRGPDEGNGDFYADSIHVTEGGGIGMNVGGLVIVMPIREWHALAARKSPDNDDHELLLADFREWATHKPDCAGGDGTRCACGFLDVWSAWTTQSGG